MKDGVKVMKNISFHLASWVTMKSLEFVPCNSKLQSIDRFIKHNQDKFSLVMVDR